VAEDLWQTLTRFHREIAVPELERIVDSRITPFRDETNSQLDAIWKELHDLKQEYYAITAGLKRLETKVEGIIARELDELKERVAALEQRLTSLETRASGGTRI
jgi:archaellum component FlaC